jgi:hypothetical protein
MHLPINVKPPNNINKWQMGFNSAFRGLICKEKLMKLRVEIEFMTFPPVLFFCKVFLRVKDRNKQIKLFGAVVYGNVC